MDFNISDKDQEPTPGVAQLFLAAAQCAQIAEEQVELEVQKILGIECDGPNQPIIGVDCDTYDWSIEINLHGLKNWAWFDITEKQVKEILALGCNCFWINLYHMEGGKKIAELVCGLHQGRYHHDRKDYLHTSNN